MTIAELKEIALHAAKGTVPATYANQDVDVNQAFVDGLRELAGSVNEFMRNRYDIYQILIETTDAVMPKKVLDAIGAFAEVKFIPQGAKAMFKQPVGKNRAKMFLTQVGLSGVYETFRLDQTTFEINPHAVGGGATIDFERMLDGAESLADVMEVLSEGLTDAVMVEVNKALQAAINASNKPAANKVTGTYSAEHLLKLCNTVRAYGDPVIYACPEFVAKMGPDAIVPALTNAQGIYHPDDIDAIHNTGYVRIFRGCPIVMIPQSFTDETNEYTVFNPQFAYVFPSGKQKAVKVAIEGQTQVHDFTNRDNSLEVYVYRKMGVGILTQNTWGIYQNTGINDTHKDMYNL